MKTLALTLAALMPTAGVALFDVGQTETFDIDLGNWQTAGHVAWSNALSYGNGGYAKLGKIGTDNDNLFWHEFVVPMTGQYALNFDYRYIGWDHSRDNDRSAAAIKTIGNIWTTNSAIGLANSLEWQTAAIPPFTVELIGGEQYWLGFRLKEFKDTNPLKRLKLMTSLHIDNVSLSFLNSVPEPAAIILSSIGISLVGWLKTRMVLQ